MKKVNVINILVLIFFVTCTTTKQEHQKSINTNQDKIQVLNFGTFHFGYTTDANSTTFDEKNDKNKAAAHDIAKQIAEFKPTVILVESLPEHNQGLQNVYAKYLENPAMTFQNPNEIQLLAFEVGRLSNVKRIYGIDHKINYNYNIDSEITNTIDSITNQTFNQNPFKNFPDIIVNDNELSLLDKLKKRNSDDYLDFMIVANAEILTHAGTDGKFEGADEAAKFYQRNLRMYSNLNRIALEKDDRVFILMGAAHTAFFREFLSRSPKYRMVNTFQYLK